jgi:hypothetical protein
MRARSPSVDHLPHLGARLELLVVCADSSAGRCYGDHQPVDRKMMDAISGLALPILGLPFPQSGVAS